MVYMTKSIKVGIVALFSPVLAANLCASSIGIVNPSFESLGNLNNGYLTCASIAVFQAKGCRTDENPGTGWIGSFAGGADNTMQFGVTSPYLTGDLSLTGLDPSYVTGVKDPGPNVAGGSYGYVALRGAGATLNTQVDLTQTLTGVFLELNLDYILRVSVGYRAQAATPTAYSVILGTTTGGELASNSVALTPGQWTDVAVVYSSGASNARAGQTLTITLRGLSTVETGFDNVRLDAAVPEPGTVFLLGGSLLGLWAYRRKRASKV